MGHRNRVLGRFAHGDQVDCARCKCRTHWNMSNEFISIFFNAQNRPRNLIARIYGYDNLPKLPVNSQWLVSKQFQLFKVLLGHYIRSSRGSGRIVLRLDRLWAHLKYNQDLIFSYRTVFVQLFIICNWIFITLIKRIFNIKWQLSFFLLQSENCLQCGMMQ